MGKILNAAGAVIAGVGGTILLFWLMNKMVEALPEHWEERLKPYAFIGPALIFVGVFLVFPAVNTVYISFFDDRSEGFVGLQNYGDVLTDPALISSLINNLLWLLIVPIVSVSLGLIIAVLADRLSARGEKAHEVGDLPPDGDQRGGGVDDLAVRLRVAAGQPGPDRPAQRGLDRVRRRAGGLVAGL